MSDQHPEIIAAPFTVWIAPVGTAFPAIDEVPAAPWTLLGSNGDRNYAGGGVTVSHQRQLQFATPAGVLGAAVAFAENDSLRVRLELLDMTLEQYAVVMGGNAVVTTPPAIGVAGIKVLGLGLKTGPLPEYAVLARGPSPYAEGMPAQYELPRCIEAGSPAPTFRGGVPAGLSVELTALEDPAATSEEERFGRLVAQYADPLPLLPLVISGTPPASAIAGAFYSFTPSVSGDFPPYTFSLTGDLPPGLTFDTDTGTISGTAL